MEWKLCTPYWIPFFNMVAMKLFPFHRTTISTKLTSDEIDSKLRSFIEFGVPDSLFSNKFYGEITKNSFSIYKSSYFLSMVLVKIRGKIEKESDCTNEIKLTFFLAEVPFVLFILMIISMVVLFVFTLTYTEVIWLKFTPLAGIISAYLIFSIPFYFIGRYCKKYIQEKLEGKEILSS